MKRALMRCPKCAYEWTPITDTPKVCTRCKVRLDYGKWAINKGAK